MPTIGNTVKIFIFLLYLSTSIAHQLEPVSGTIIEIYDFLIFFYVFINACFNVFNINRIKVTFIH